MAKFLKIGSAGTIAEEAAVATSSGAGDSGKLPQLDSGGKLHISFLPNGVGADVRTVTAGETLTALDLIYVSASSTVMKADANALAKAATGFVPSGIANAASGDAYFGSSIISGLSGLTPGAKYFLSNATPGAIDLYASLTFSANDIVQEIGYALSATELYFEPQPPIVVS